MEVYISLRMRACRVSICAMADNAADDKIRCSRSPHWSYCLLITIILTVSVAVLLVLLPYFLRDRYPLSVRILTVSAIGKPIG